MNPSQFNLAHNFNLVTVLVIGVDKTTILSGIDWVSPFM